MSTGSVLLVQPSAERPSAPRLHPEAPSFYLRAGLEPRAMPGSALPMPLQGLPGRNGVSGQQGSPGPRVSHGESWGAWSGEDPSSFTRAQGGAHVVHQPEGSLRSEVPPQEAQLPTAEHTACLSSRVLVVSVTGKVAHTVEMACPWGHWFAQIFTFTLKENLFFLYGVWCIDMLNSQKMISEYFPMESQFKLCWCHLLLRGLGLVYSEVTWCLGFLCFLSLGPREAARPSFWLWSGVAARTSVNLVWMPQAS